MKEMKIPGERDVGECVLKLLSVFLPQMHRLAQIICVNLCICGKLLSPASLLKSHSQQPLATKNKINLLTKTIKTAINNNPEINIHKIVS